jgi:hypothetical protein
MKSRLTYATLDTLLAVIMVAFATASTLFGLVWSLHASLLLPG